MIGEVIRRSAKHKSGKTMMFFDRPSARYTFWVSEEDRWKGIAGLTGCQ
jgi:hypothetical protein